MQKLMRKMARRSLQIILIPVWFGVVLVLKFESKFDRIPRVTWGEIGHAWLAAWKTA